ncbi:MAG TPA: NAD(+)/NADH kinase [Candidatus Acidoferrum sp.]|nr:NAD(+)/NADH kinase [Candidatus Acidoferrum sp.]
MEPETAFRTIGIFSRPRREQLSVVVPPLLKWLEARGIKTALDEETAAALPAGSKGQKRPAVADASQLLLVLGGDGTMLAAARLAAPRGIPILPINMGSLGFLTSFTLDELYPALEETLAGNSSVSQRVMLQAELVRSGSVVESQSALNDVVIHKGALARMIQLELSINSDFVCRYRADGLIVSSPTGSTAYSLSAGGPIVHPAVEAFIITPICPHMLTDRPLVVRDYCCLEVKMNGDAESVYLTLDGQRGVPLESTDILRVERAKEHLQLIQPPKKPYFEILRNKLKWGEA